ncbi:MAG: alpha/beta hydrolase family protein [Mucilaginibacter sp.]
MNTRIFVLLLLITAFVTDSVVAARVDTVSTTSTSMHEKIKAVVIIPDRYDTKVTYPVLYLLHGYSGNYADWITKAPEVKSLADTYDMIIVCPDGGPDSWYVDSPVKAGSMYETYVGTELPAWIDEHYSTIKNRAGRAITGLSMGGHGALFIAFRHQDIFGAAGSMSGGVDLRPFPTQWNLDHVLGSYSQNPDRWDKYSVINLTYLLTPGSLALTFDCGSQDFFYQVNKNLHDKLLERNIPHDFTVRPGGHTWDYWGNSINYQALFFSGFFNKNKLKLEIPEPLTSDSGNRYR